MRAFILIALSMSLGCLQLTGVADYKVEETPPAPVCSPPPGSVCRVGPNCGCPDDQTCALTSVAGTGECQPAGSTPRGGTCAATTECGRGMVCINNICLPYCGTDTDCDTKQCEAMTTSDGTPINNVGFCGTPCDPANNTCPDSLQCLQTSETRFSCLPPSG